MFGSATNEMLLFTMVSIILPISDRKCVRRLFVCFCIFLHFFVGGGGGGTLYNNRTIDISIYMKLLMNRWTLGGNGLPSSSPAKNF